LDALGLARIKARAACRENRAGWLEEQPGALGLDADEATPRVLLMHKLLPQPVGARNLSGLLHRAGSLGGLSRPDSKGRNSADIHMVIDALDLFAHLTRYGKLLILSFDAVSPDNSPTYAHRPPGLLPL
jgi:hypothetical protein